MLPSLGVSPRVDGQAPPIAHIPTLGSRSRLAHVLLCPFRCFISREIIVLLNQSLKFQSLLRRWFRCIGGQEMERHLCGVLHPIIWVRCQAGGWYWLWLLGWSLHASQPYLGRSLGTACSFVGPILDTHPYTYLPIGGAGAGAVLLCWAQGRSAGGGAPAGSCDSGALGVTAPSRITHLLLPPPSVPSAPARTAFHTTRTPGRWCGQFPLPPPPLPPLPLHLPRSRGLSQLLLACSMFGGMGRTSFIIVVGSITSATVAQPINLCRVLHCPLPAPGIVGLGRGGCATVPAVSCDRGVGGYSTQQNHPLVTSTSLSAPARTAFHTTRTPGWPCCRFPPPLPPLQPPSLPLPRCTPGP